MTIPFELMVEVAECALAPWRGFGLKQPTPASVKKINDELGARLPDSLVALARAAPSYGSWFGGLGEDYEHPMHILTHNQEFHDPDQAEGDAPLPGHLVVLNHGHDGDCDCWDIRHSSDAGEHPIVFVDFESGSVSEEGFLSFAEYLESFCRSYGPEVKDKKAAARVAEILAGYPG